MRGGPWPNLPPCGSAPELKWTRRCFRAPPRLHESFHLDPRSFISNWDQKLIQLIDVNTNKHTIPAGTAPSLTTHQLEGNHATKPNVTRCGPVSFTHRFHPLPAEQAARTNLSVQCSADEWRRVLRIHGSNQPSSRHPKAKDPKSPTVWRVSLFRLGNRWCNFHNVEGTTVPVITWERFGQLHSDVDWTW